MSQHENLATIQTIYEAFGRGDVETILAALTDDVDWASDSAGALAPWHGQLVGKDAVAGFFGGLAGSLEVTEFTTVSLAATDDEVFAFIRFGFRGTATGKEGRTNLHHYWRFRDGKVDYYRGSEDTALTAEVIGALAAARAGAERARSELTWDAAAAKHLHLYRELL